LVPKSTNTNESNLQSFQTFVPNDTLADIGESLVFNGYATTLNDPSHNLPPYPKPNLAGFDHVPVNV
jgi:hypothetical protein